MKKILLTLFLCFFATMSLAADIELLWDANSESDLAGYKIYYGDRSRNQYGGANNYDVIIDVGNVTSFEIKDLAYDRWYFTATAYDTSGNESGFSNEVNVTLEEPPPPSDDDPPGAPQNVTIRIIITVQNN